MMQGKKVTQQFIEIKPCRVVTRASTDVIAVDDAHVSKAAKYINDSCRQTIYVEDVAKAAGLSRRVLEKRFRALLNQSINDHIRLCRVNLIIKMLTETALPISEIAISMGFPDAAHIARYFRKTMHTSPAEYRHKYRL
jgi:LacI family transcriptional regulator